MKGLRYGLLAAAREHLAAGEPITRLEALVLYGVSNLTDVISEMRQQGWVVESRPVAYAGRRPGEPVRRAEPPANLPVREIQLTEYWMGRAMRRHFARQRRVLAWVAGGAVPDAGGGWTTVFMPTMSSRSRGAARR